jgi:hypothetical protein
MKFGSKTVLGKTGLSVDRLGISSRKIISAILLGFIVLAGGCTYRNPYLMMSAHNLSPGYRILDHTYWWKCSFKNVWKENKRPDLVVDLLLAHGVVSPVLAEHINDIPYWRFHRRAMRDPAGHRFTFLFYSEPETASTVFSKIRQSRVLKKAMAANLVEKVTLEDPNHPRFPDIEDTSDHHWSSDLQKNWPTFIMGASSLWLGLIDAYMHESPEDFDDINRLLEKYREVDAKIADTWRKEGQHALFHHLNAVFGYKPLLIRKELSF